MPFILSGRPRFHICVERLGNSNFSAPADLITSHDDGVDILDSFVLDTKLSSRCWDQMVQRRRTNDHTRYRTLRVHEFIAEEGNNDLLGVVLCILDVG